MANNSNFILPLLVGSEPPEEAFKPNGKPKGGKTFHKIVGKLFPITQGFLRTAIDKPCRSGRAARMKT
jgi:hypothetical protein